MKQVSKTFKYLPKYIEKRLREYAQGKDDKELDEKIKLLPEKQRKELLSTRNRAINLQKNKNGEFGHPKETEEILQTIPDRHVAEKLSMFIYGILSEEDVKHELFLAEMFREEILEARQSFSSAQALKEEIKPNESSLKKRLNPYNTFIVLMALSGFTILGFEFHEITSEQASSNAVEQIQVEEASNGSMIASSQQEPLCGLELKSAYKQVFQLAEQAITQKCDAPNNTILHIKAKLSPHGTFGSLHVTSKAGLEFDECAKNVIKDLELPRACESFTISKTYYL